MNNSPRWRLTLQFVALTFIIYLLLLGAGVLIFRAELTKTMDNQLDNLLAELIDSVELQDGVLRLQKTTSLIKKQPLRRLARIQLFNKERALLEQYGVRSAAPRLIDTSVELRDGAVHLRSKSISIDTDNDTTLGYLQVQIPTTMRERAETNYSFTMGILTLLGFVVLFAAGMAFSKRAAKPLELSYQMLRQFSADAAHELGTPIATITAAADNMREELDAPASLEKRITVIERASRRMSKLVDDLMILTRLGVESEVQASTAETIHLEELVGHAIEDFEDRYRMKDVSLESGKMDEVLVMGFKNNLERLLNNLLENALRYTDSGGTVTVALLLDSGHARLEVRDTGIGIPQDSIPRLFDRFYRVDKARSREMGGNGLGLAIVKAIVAMHNGEIDVTSKVDEGTTFTVSIPAVG